LSLQTPFRMIELREVGYPAGEKQACGAWGGEER
jgi:hypothetical protein